MSKPLTGGANLSKKPDNSKPAAPKRRPIFGGDGDSDDDHAVKTETKAEAITGLEDSTWPSTSSLGSSGKRVDTKSRPQPPKGPPRPRQLDRAGQPTELGDLSSALTSRKYAESAEKEDPSIYDYDASYDSFKAPARKAAAGGGAAGAERKPQYMASLKKMAEVRERDRKIAEDKKMKREREAEGDEFADKEKFVTEAYKQQQEDNRRLEEEERRREEEEARKNLSGGMTSFYKRMLERDDQRHAELLRAAELQQKADRPSQKADEASLDEDKNEVDMAREINRKGGSVAINEDGQVVDKRELLKGGLNLLSRKKTGTPTGQDRGEVGGGRREQGRGSFPGGRGKQGMRDRQSRMLEAQYEQALKRSREEAEEERKKVELGSKSQKTAADISSAKERYLARKKAEAEVKAKELLGYP